MAYVCELGTGQKVYLENQGTQTVVTTLSGSLGQQQQSSSSFTTGIWTLPPEMFQTPNGFVLKISTNQGEHYIQIQGNSMGVMSASPSLGSSQQMQVQQVANASSFSMSPLPPIQPMQPMQPMSMGDMQMSQNPMAMRMGNMAMSMGTPAQPTQSIKSFCSQCGAKVGASDRFCSSCGHQLS